jgi:hypothetical protein
MFDILKYSLNCNLRINIIPLSDNKIQITIYDVYDNVCATCIIDMKDYIGKEDIILQEKFKQLTTDMAHVKANLFNQKYASLQRRIFEEFWENK